MFDPVSIGVALTAVQSAVKLVKQASQTVNDVTSLGPVLAGSPERSASAEVQCPSAIAGSNG